MKLKRIFNTRVRISCISIIIVAVSLFLPAVTYSNYSGQHILQGVEMILMGPMAILGGVYLEWIVWLANPLSVISIVFFVQKKPEAKITSLIALGLAASFMLWQEILVSESGIEATIEHKEIGYGLWLLSILILAIGIQTHLKPKNKKEEINDAANAGINPDKTSLENLNMLLINRSMVNEYKEKYLNMTNNQLESKVRDARYVLDARLAAKEVLAERNGNPS